MPPFEVQVFEPFSTYWPPSWRALVCIAATSEPASGSESANAAMALPSATRGSQSERICSPPASDSGALPSPCMAKAKSASPS